MTPIDLSPSDLILAALSLLMASGLSVMLDLRISRMLAIAALRMTAQLVLVGLVLRHVFALSTPVVTLAATSGKRFAVIADEAHSSQTGEAASKLKQVLSAEELAEMQDGGEFSAEDVLAANMAAKAGASGISFIAFTATPKAKTLELFGRRPDPGSLPAPFHVYSMRQAIEEGFILDVLKN